MQIVQYAKDHPIMTTIIVVVGGLIFFTIVSGGSGSSSSGGASRPSDAEILADAQVKGAQIAAQAQAATAGAAVSAAQIGAGVQLNSDNKAAEIVMAQINAAKELGISQEQTKIAAIGNIGRFTGKGGYDEQKAAALQTIFSGQNAPIPIKQSNPGNSAGAIIGSLGNLASGIGSIFSDERLKENIRHIGFDDNGRELYTFNYKGSRKKRTGYIAQSIERSEKQRVISDKRGFKKIKMW